MNIFNRLRKEAFTFSKMKTIKDSFENVAKRQKLLTIETNSCLDSMLSKFDTYETNHQNKEQLIKDIKILASKLTDSTKDFYTVVGKHSKVIEKRFKSDLNTIWDPNALMGKEPIATQILIQHFIREGRFDLAKIFAIEAGLEFKENLHSHFQGMFQIQQSLRAENPDPAIQWTELNRKTLEETNSSFEFKLHQLKFLGFVTNGNYSTALQYAKSHFHRFSHKYMKEIQRLMCCVLFAKRLENSPYHQYSGSKLWIDIQNQFSRDFCNILGQSCESPLFTSVTVGSTALPMIMKISSLMKDKALEWSQTGELPVTIPLLESQKYHSIFVCPVTKEQGTEINPPMMMVCGHVISSESLTRLSKGNLNSRFKCPYCPVESSSSQAVEVFF